MMSADMSITGKGHIANRQFEIYSVDTLLREIAEKGRSILMQQAYTIIWVIKGCGEIKIDLDSYVIEDGTVYYIKPGQEFMLNMQEDVKGYSIRFTREFFELYEKKSPALINSAFFDPSLMMPAIKLSIDAIVFLRRLVSEMLSEFKSYLELRAEILQGYLKIFIIYLSRQFKSSNDNFANSGKKELTKKFQELLEKLFATKKQVKEYASLLAVTPNYLNNSVKEISGFTASYHIQKRVVLEAKRRAIYEGFNMKETAYCLGFLDPAHFSKYFKNGSGVNFTSFRKDFSGF